MIPKVVQEKKKNQINLTHICSFQETMCSHSCWTEALQLIKCKENVKLSVEECIAVVVFHLEPSCPELCLFEEERRTFRVGVNGERNDLFSVFLKTGT